MGKTEAKSTLATPLFSCKVTQADFESDEMVIYSGSISAAKLAPAFPILNPAFVKLPEK
jgi:hypothetical protein